MKHKILRMLLLGVWLAASMGSRAGDDLIGIDGNAGQYTGFSNQASILNTRHNLTQSTLTNLFGGRGNMAPYRNDYGQVCVYCHTPHGANSSAAAPLWNRAIPATTYTTYNQLGTGVEQTYAQPGGASLACLSCHDGQQAVDAIINMPGSGRYNPTPSSNSGFGGDLWTRWNVTGKRSLDHGALRPGAPNDSQSCLSCHSPSGTAAAVDFTVFAIGTDLRNDHPIGVTYPTVNGSGTGWNTPTGTKTVGGQTTKFFDDTANGRLDKSEIRLYAAANGSSSECASCHDPHGVPSGAPGSAFLPTFLRKPIDGSGVCLTCHAK